MRKFRVAKGTVCYLYDVEYDYNVSVNSAYTLQMLSEKNVCYNEKEIVRETASFLWFRLPDNKKGFKAIAFNKESINEYND